MRRLLSLLALLVFAPALAAQTGTALFQAVDFSPDASGAVPEGVAFRIVAEAPGGPVVEATTDADGFLRAEGLPEGLYYAFATADSGYLTFFNAVLAEVRADAGATGLVIVQAEDPARATVRGQVTDADTGAPIPFQILVPSPDGLAQGSLDFGIASVDEAGRYAYQVDPGDYALTYGLYAGNATGDEVAYRPVEVAFSATAGAETVVDAAFEARQPGTLAGTVTAEGTGAPIAGAFITVYATDGSITRTATTDAAGTFSLDVPENTYVVLVEAPGFVREFAGGSRTFAGAEAVTVAPEETTVVAIALDAPAADFAVSFSGRLLDTAGQPIERGFVLPYVLDSAVPSIGLLPVDDEGRFTFETEDPAFAGSQIVVGFLAGGYVPEFYDDATDFLLATRLPVGVDAVSYELGDVVLRAEGEDVAGFAVAGTVADLDGGAPVAGAQVALTRIDAPGLHIVTADEAGVFETDGLAPGEYVVLFAADGYAAAYLGGARTWREATRLTVQSDVRGVAGFIGGLNRPVRGGRQNLSTVQGTVRGDDGAPLAGALVVATDLGGTPIASTLADATGRFSLENVSGGAVLAAERPRYGSARVVAADGPGVVRFTLDAANAVATDDDAPASASPSLLVAPNPTSGLARVRFEVAAAGPVRIALYDVLGREVAVVAEGDRPAGPAEASLLTSGLAPGVYVVRVVTEAGTAAVPLTVVR